MLSYIYSSNWNERSRIIEERKVAKLEGKIALITGGTTGIGLASAKLFQEEGAQVIITGRSAGTLAEAQQELGPKAVVIQSDTSKLADIDHLIEQVRTRFGRIDILFANAGVAFFAPIGQSDEAFFDNHFNINVKGLFFTVQRALPLIPDGGSIVLTSSVVASKGFVDTAVYSATKAAVRSFGRTLAAELAPRRIRVNTVSPGPIATPIFDKMKLPPEAAQATEEALRSGVALKRLGNADEVAKVALFLASDDASYVVGAEVLVDGGLAGL